MGDPLYSTYPDLQLSQQVFTISNSYSTPAAQEVALTALQDAIKSKKMAPLYKFLAHPTEGILNPSGEGSSQHPVALKRQFSGSSSLLAPKRASSGVSLPWDETLYEELVKDNEAELEKIQKEEDEAIEKAGDVEIQAARGQRAEFYARVGEKEKALSSFESVFEKSSILGTKIDIVFALLRIGLFFNDRPFVAKTIDRANTLVESGGDWDRRNRLKAYQGIHLLTVRNYAAAAPLLLDSLSTFTSYELCTYSALIIYAVLAGSVSLQRVDFKSKVVDAPEIKAVIGGGDDRLLGLIGSGSGDEEMKDAEVSTSATPVPAVVNLTTLGQSTTEATAAQEEVDFKPLANLVNSLYSGNYRPFFGALGAVEQNFLCLDRHLAEHKAWFVREMRLRAYQQLLQSYRVVGLSSMAGEFGVSVDFLDRDLKNFIAADRVSCTVDRVNGVIETNRPDEKNKQYNDIVKQGDQLITKLQKYGQAVRLKEG